MRTDLFDYHLPAERIAQEPLAERDASRLLVVHRAARRLEHAVFRDIGRYLESGDTLFRNNAAVLPARLRAVKPTGGAVECLLLRPSPDPLAWWCLLRPGRRLQPGAEFGVEGAFRAVVEQRGERGESLVRFTLAVDAHVVDLARRIGAVPLPPYIERTEADPRSAADRERYQTVYADGARPVAAAAPTAGLHFTPRLIESLRRRGVACADLTLHVGMGTFQPIEAEHVEDHRIHTELYEIPPSTLRLLLQPTGRRVAVGTTSLRAIEDHVRRGAAPVCPPTEASLFIHPPAVFRGVDALVTNFHQPRSTLLCLVAAFLAPGGDAGIAWLREIYAEALRAEYRFLSYGDAMLIV